MNVRQSPNKWHSKSECVRGVDETASRSMVSRVRMLRHAASNTNDWGKMRYILRTRFRDWPHTKNNYQRHHHHLVQARQQHHLMMAKVSNTRKVVKYMKIMFRSAMLVDRNLLVVGQKWRGMSHLKNFPPMHSLRHQVWGLQIPTIPTTTADTSHTTVTAIICTDTRKLPMLTHPILPTGNWCNNHHN